MAKAPDRRYESCRDFAEALRETLGLAPYAPAGSAPTPGHLPSQGTASSGFPGPAGYEAPVDADHGSAETIDSAPGARQADAGEMLPPEAMMRGATHVGRDPDDRAGTMPGRAGAITAEQNLPYPLAGSRDALPSGPAHAHRRRRSTWIGVIAAAGSVLVAAGLAAGTLGLTSHPKTSPTPAGSAHSAAAATIPRGPTAYVLVSNAVVPVDLTTDVAGKPIVIGAGGPGGIAVTPDGRMAYVTNGTTIIPINLATRRLGKPINVKAQVSAIVVTPDGKTAFVADDTGVGYVIRVNLVTDTYGKPIEVDHLLSLPGGGTVGDGPIVLTISPDGKTVYTANYEAWTVTPIDVAAGTRGTPIRVGQNPTR